jgi:hypothetical protein
MCLMWSGHCAGNALGVRCLSVSFTRMVSRLRTCDTGATAIVQRHAWMGGWVQGGLSQVQAPGAAAVMTFMHLVFGLETEQARIRCLRNGVGTPVLWIKCGQPPTASGRTNAVQQSVCLSLERT